MNKLRGLHEPDLKEKISHLDYLLEVLKGKNSKSVLDKMMQNPQKYVQISTPTGLYWLNMEIMDCHNCSSFGECPSSDFCVSVDLWKEKNGESELIQGLQQTVHSSLGESVYDVDVIGMARELILEEKRILSNKLKAIGFAK